MTTVAYNSGERAALKVHSSNRLALFGMGVLSLAAMYGLSKLNMHYYDESMKLGVRYVQAALLAVTAFSFVVTSFDKYKAGYSVLIHEGTKHDPNARFKDLSEQREVTGLTEEQFAATQPTAENTRNTDPSDYGLYMRPHSSSSQ